MEFDFSVDQVSLGVLQTVANSDEKTPLSDVAKDVLADAGYGAMGGALAGAAITAVAVALGADIATASTVVVAAGTAIATGAGAGTALGSTLGPIGAVVGLVIGLFAALGSLAATHYDRPSEGTALGLWGRAYLQSHPVNPILAIALQHWSYTAVALRSAFDQLDWAPFEAALAIVFEIKDGRGIVGLRSDSEASNSIRAFLYDLSARGVPQKVAYNVIDLYCDFMARVRIAEAKFVSVHPGPVGDYEGYGLSNWVSADAQATLAFLGAPESAIKKVATRADEGGTPIVTWQDANGNTRPPTLPGFDVDKQAKDPKSWGDVSNSPYFKDIQVALRGVFDHAPRRIQITHLVKRNAMHEALEFAKEKAEEAVEVVYKDGKVTKVGKGVGIAAGILVVLKVLAGRR